MNRIQNYIYSFIFLALICPGNLYAQAVSGTLNGHDYVDLGLSVKWATCNVGAGKPSDYGNYYAWGETEIKSSYTEDNCETWEKQIGDIGFTSRDVAHVKWGGSWRMPTEVEFEELLDENNCDWTWITMNGVNGYKVTSKKPGYKDNYIFLPTAGRHFDTPPPITRVRMVTIGARHRTRTMLGVRCTCTSTATTHANLRKAAAQGYRCVLCQNKNINCRLGYMHGDLLTKFYK